MPRSMAPPPSGEFSIVLKKPFAGGVPTQKIEFIGEPNRPSNVKITNHTGKDLQNIIEKTGQVQADDVNELLTLLHQFEGLPTNPTEDIYGFDTRITLTTFEVQWDNGEDVEGEAQTNPTDENKQTFKDVMDSIGSLARMCAK